MATLERLLNLLTRRFGSAIGLLALAYGLATVPAVVELWRVRSAFEPEWIANALVAGQGYSWEGPYRWLFEGSPTGEYFSTAWADPVFTFWLAGLIAVFGEYARLVGVLASIGFVLGAAWFTALAARFLGGPLAGVMAAFIFLGVVRGLSINLNASLLGGFWISLLLYYLITRISDLRVGHGLILGLVLGIAILTWSSLMILLPTLALLLVCLAPSWWLAVRTSALMMVTVLCLVSPWTLRNYVVFNEFVPVRNGLGQIAHLGTVGLAKTYAPESVETPVPAPWTARGPFEAVERTLERVATPEDRRAIERWQREVMRLSAIPGYEAMNEAQRDQLYRRDAVRFIVAEPRRVLELAMPKLTAFFTLRGGFGAVITGVGVVAGIVALAWQPLLVVPLTLIVAYALPFAIIVPYFWRYRYPVEPMIATVTAVSFVVLGTALFQWFAARRVRSSRLG